MTSVPDETLLVTKEKDSLNTWHRAFFSSEMFFRAFVVTEPQSSYALSQQLMN
jgi:hypothetical protein